MADKQPAAPTHRVYTVIKREGQDDYWLNIGLAFPHKDGNGFNIVLQALPLDGKIVCREITNEERRGERAVTRSPGRRPQRSERAPAMSPEMRRAKLAKLIEIEGFDDEDALFAAAISDSVCPAICCNPDNPDCDYTAEMEPDQDRGWCEMCERGTLVSALVLGGLI